MDEKLRTEWHKALAYAKYMLRRWVLSSELKALSIDAAKCISNKFGLSILPKIIGFL